MCDLFGLLIPCTEWGVRGGPSGPFYIGTLLCPVHCIPRDIDRIVIDLWNTTVFLKLYYMRSSSEPQASEKSEPLRSNATAPFGSIAEIAKPEGDRMAQPGGFASSTTLFFSVLLFEDNPQPHSWSRNSRRLYVNRVAHWVGINFELHRTGVALGQLPAIPMQ